MRTMVFHAPYPFDATSVSASAVRPRRIYQAFKDAGYEVLDITGNAAERKRKFRAVQARIQRGQVIDFVYGENATIPPSITEPRHLPPHPWLDPAMLRYFHSQQIPVGIFYRDIYWAMPDYPERVGQPLASAMRALYRWELESYRRYTNIIYVPSLEMAAEVEPLQRLAARQQLRTLPPGGLVRGEPSPAHPLHLLYVGGIGQHYRLHQLVEAVKARPQVRLTICADPARWEAEAAGYRIEGATNIELAYARDDALDDLYRQANVAVLAVEPMDYWRFAVPVKLYEYIGRCKPILVSAGLHAADVVDELGAGWVCDYDAAKIGAQLDRLDREPQLVGDVTNRVMAIRSQHSWVARARQVAQDLTGQAEGSGRKLH